jgi:putative ABC transport system permease protein
LRIKNISCEIIGTLGPKGQGGFGNDQDDIVLMPYKTVQRRFTGNRDVQLIMVAVDPRLRQRHDPGFDQPTCCASAATSPTKADDFSILDTKQISDALGNATRN